MKTKTKTKITSNKKRKYQIEYEIKSSPRILYNYISTPNGLGEWFANDVNVREGIYTFKWEGSEAKAKLINKKENQSVRFKWIDDPEKDAYFEFEIVQDDITSDVALIVTDFATASEEKENRLLWNSQIQNLRHTIGS